MRLTMPQEVADLGGDAANVVLAENIVRAGRAAHA
ncbi:hypothetical protein JOF41_003564 [Saccharothrix coeruleofusca]|nr:hypothetical protein [Saccharothrix coeruleofusca]